MKLWVGTGICSLGTLGAKGSCRMHQKPGKQIIFCWHVWLLCGPVGGILKLAPSLRLNKGSVGNFRQQKFRIVSLVFSEQLLGETDLHLRTVCEEAPISRPDTQIPTKCYFLLVPCNYS